jgi:hypothetical protein
VTGPLALPDFSGIAPLTRTDPPPLIPVWYTADLATGALLDELPLTPSPISRVIGQPMSTSMDLVLAGAPAGWIEETQPGRTMIVCVVDSVPLWAGINIGRTRGSAPTSTLSLVTPEAYLDRRYCSNHSWVGVDECSVVGAGLIGDCAVNGIGLVVDAPADGTLITATYADSDDTTVLSALTSLMQTGSPEFTVDVGWTDATMTDFTLTVRLRHTLGTASTSPNAVFELPGAVTAYAQAESYQSGSGASAARAYGNGEGASRASSGDVLSAGVLGAGWPRWDYRWTPNQATTDPAVLTAAAARAVAAMATGTSLWTLDAAASQAPRPGTDFALGDSVGLLVDPGSSPGHPAGVNVTARALGWSLDFTADKLTPVLSGGS